MLIHRCEVVNTSKYVDNICSVIEDPKCTKVILIATVKEDEAREQAMDLPQLVAVGVYDIPVVDKLYLIFDGTNLSVARYPRYLEVRDILDVAQKTDKVFYCEARAPLTSDLDDKATLYTLLAAPHRPLNVESRPAYFELLSNFTEEEFVRIYK